MASPYQVLGVDPDADRETVERRYRELVKEVHPDAGGSAEEFKRVKRAYRAIVSDRGTGASSTGRQGGSTAGSGRDRSGPTGPGSSRSSSSRGGAGSSGRGAGSSSGASGTGGRGAGSRAGGTGTDRRRSGATGSDGGSNRRYTAAGRERRAAGATGAGQRAGGTTGTGRSGSGSPGSGQGSSADRTTGGSGDSAWVPRRWFLYGFSALFAGGAYALRDQTFSDLLAEDSGGEEPERSAASGLPVRDSASREVGPQELFDVQFQTPAQSTVRFTVDGADSRDWVNVYTPEEYERVASDWDGEGQFDPGEPLRTVLTGDGYVADLPEAGSYVILIKLWAGPPNDPRDPRTVEVSYEVTA
jgi:hypothetical protein